jgi:hypothetical protein
MRGESGTERKAQKRRHPLVVCGMCGKAGGTMVRQAGGYVHQACQACQAER